MKFDTPAKWFRVLVPLGLIIVVFCGQLLRAYISDYATNAGYHWIVEPVDGDLVIGGDNGRYANQFAWSMQIGVT